MTQEEKAKAYDKALKRARLYYCDEVTQVVRDTVSYIFPELKENEDERISREITEFILTHRIDTPNDIEDTDSWLAWLEKQNKKLPAGFYYVNSKGEKFYSNKFKYGNVTLSIEKQGEIDNVPPQNLGNCVVTNSNK